MTSEERIARLEKQLGRQRVVGVFVLAATALVVGVAAQKPEKKNGDRLMINQDARIQGNLDVRGLTVSDAAGRPRVVIASNQQGTSVILRAADGQTPRISLNLGDSDQSGSILFHDLKGKPRLQFVSEPAESGNFRVYERWNFDPSVSKDEDPSKKSLGTYYFNSQVSGP
ncbi:MAG: hypothetical protein JWN86_3557 [Planctomycetota bacterium]|nr:hypothetical protein [Planctomycetota bacterium]